MDGIRHAWKVVTFSDVPSSSQNDSATRRYSSSLSSRCGRRHPRRILLHRACSLPVQHDIPHYGIRSVRPGAYDVTRTRGSPRQHRLAIPEGTQPGAQFTAIVGTQEIHAQCPVRPGNFVRVMVPGEPITRQTFLKMAPLTS